MKMVFLPIGIAAGLAAGQLSKKVFDAVWSVFDDEEAPRPKHRQISIIKLVPALAVEGAIFRTVRGLADHGTRRGFAKVTGSWPGEEAPEPE
jgi:Protein of unknown function (DUF4235)